MRALACIILTLAVAGCVSQDDIEIAQCKRAGNLPDQNTCMIEHNARFYARRAARQQEERMNSSTMAVLAGTAFLNGYNGAQPGPMVMCQHVGMMTLCQ